MTSPCDCLRAAALVAAFGVFVLYPGASRSGDEVDYSAPYLVVENGELVTRYPAKAHEPDQAIAGEAASADSDDTGMPAWLTPALILAVAACVGGLAFARWRK